ncbi:MAG: acyclic terpene utilization AtuA family protein [Bacteroidota bacterium]
MPTPKEKLIIANISGFYGDRISAAKEMVEGGPVDFLTGDYLAELTMAILFKSKSKKPELGYATTFLKQMEAVMGPCLDKGIKVVVNAGGLNPSGLAKALEGVAETLQLHPKIAYIQGDDLISRLTDFRKQGIQLQHLDTGINLADSKMIPVSANAYLGCWGVVEALNRGANIVVTGRIADTSVVMGPAAYHFGWKQDNWNALAGAATAGHIIECSGQAVGGNYSFFEEVPSYQNVGFPIAEIHDDGSAVITKHPGTGGLISVGTVTAQLLYEVNAPAYITPDVVAHFDTIQLEQEAKDRVKVSGVKGSPATSTAKVTVNCMGGFQNTMSFHIAGLDIERKAEIFKQQFLAGIGGEDAFEQLDIQLFQTQKDNPSLNEEGFALMRVSVVDQNPKKAGKFFTSKLVELALCSIPGFCFGQPPGPARPRIVHFPALIDKQHLRQQVYLDGTMTEVEEVIGETSSMISMPALWPFDYVSFEEDKMVGTYLGRLFAARSGDKGGNANLGVWAKTPEAYTFLHAFLTVDKLKELLPDIASFEIQRYDFHTLLGLNFYLMGFLQEGVAASTKMDAQAKTLGEYLRAKWIEVPESLLKVK